MRSLLLILAGLLLIAAGAYRLFGAYEASEASAAAVAWAAIIIGTLALLGGLGRRISEAMSPPPSEEMERGHAEVRSLIQAMGAMALADGEIAGAEIQAIADIHEQMLGLKIDPDEVREILSEFSADFDIAERLERDRGLISPAMKRIIVQSCHLVMISDLNVDSAETSRIHEIGGALGYSEQETDDLIAAAAL